MSDVDILTAILDVKRKALTVAQLEALLKCIPQNEMIDILLGYEGEMDDLREAERFALTLLTIDNIEDKLKALIFSEEYDLRVSRVQKQLSILKEACNQVLSSNKFKSLLGIIITTGNFLNYGTQHGRAKGLHSSALTKILQLRAANNPAYNMMDFIVEVVELKYEDLKDFHTELTKLEEASKYQHRAIKTELKELREELESLEEQIKTTPEEEKYGIYAQFYEAIDNFLEQAKKTQQSIEDEFSSFFDLARKVLEAFGHSAGDPLGDLLGAIFQFTKKFRDIIRAKQVQQEEFEYYQRMGWLGGGMEVDEEEEDEGKENEEKKKIPKKLGVLDQVIACIIRGDYGFKSEEHMKFDYQTPQKKIDKIKGKDVEE